MRYPFRFWIAGLFCLTAVSVWGVQKPPPGPKTWNFDSDKPGEIAAGFKGEAGEWKVVADETAPSKPQALGQLAKNDDQTFNIAFLQDFKARNVDVQVKFRTVAGKLDQGGGIVWRAKDAKNYYLCRYNPLEANIRVYKVKDGARAIIHSVEDVMEVPGWQSMRIVCRGKRLEGHLNGEVRFSIVDENFLDAGMIGLWSKADAQTHFDDLQIENMDH